MGFQEGRFLYYSKGFWLILWAPIPINRFHKYFNRPILKAIQQARLKITTYIGPKNSTQGGIMNSSRTSSYWNNLIDIETLRHKSIRPILISEKRKNSMLEGTPEQILEFHIQDNSSSYITRPWWKEPENIHPYLVRHKCRMYPVIQNLVHSPF